ncbi:MAG: T9SS type A sorting domain-containing protein, partial [Bacteroidales bacterium]|nr:T9SS type A sorting domain-containing protein [Bacteroidales bacterium]
AQGITMALNLRNSPDLVNFPVSADEFVIRQTEDCTDPVSTGITGTEQTYAFSAEIVDYLGAEATIGDLLDLLNMALAGEDISPLGLSQVADAANLVNEAFDECVVVLNDQTEDLGADPNASGDSNEQGDKENEDGKKGVTGISDDQSTGNLVIYPNPGFDRFYINLSGTSQVRSAVIYNISGKPVKNLRDEEVSGWGNVTEIDASDLLPGVYIIRIDTDNGIISERFGIR